MCEDVFFKTGVLKNFAKITGKQLRQSLFLIELQADSKFFTGDCFSNFLELSMVFGQVKKYGELVYISLKIKFKHQVIYSKEKSNCEITLGADVRGCIT